MKINKKYLVGSAAALILSVCSYELGLYQARTVKENNRVSYIDRWKTSDAKNGEFDS